MKKIKTIFERDWEGSKMVVDKYVEGFSPEMLDGAKATEKVDGTNVRLTVRNNTIVRVEKRRNPDKIQKFKGIEDPWYVDASESNEDKWIIDAVKNTTLINVPDGEWSGEAIGKNIQGNPLNLEINFVLLFSLMHIPIFENVPIDFEGLKEWLPQKDSRVGKGKIEGIVWHCKNGNMFKIKAKDFEPDNR